MFRLTKHIITLIFVTHLMVAPAIAQPAAEAPVNVPPIKESDILPYLEQVIAWSRAVADTESLPDNGREMILKGKLRDESKKILRRSFDFAKAQTVIFKLDKTGSDKPEEEVESRKSRLQKAANDTDQQLADLQSQLESESLPRDKRQKLNGQVKLKQAQQELLQTMLRIFSSEGDKSGGILDQINALSRTVLDEPQDTQPATLKEDTAATTPAAKERETAQDSDGMLKLIEIIFSDSRKNSEIKHLLEQTKNVAEINQNLINSVRTALRSALAAGDTLSASDTSNAKSMAAYRQSLDQLINRYKLLSATIIPLGEISIQLGSPTRHLQEWSRLITEDWKHVLRQLMIRLTVLIVAIAIPLIFSKLAHRAIKRYVHDKKRQRQVNIARKIILGIALTFVVMANFLSEFGSLATFAGFITAGIAVALQTVLISLAAHFFYFGRYGVRSGDRITVSGVTGDVVQVGMLRLYLRELKEAENGYVQTGKIVAFPNSILFQPSAFYKHINN